MKKAGGKNWSWKPEKLVRSILSHGEKRMREIRKVEAEKYKPPSDQWVQDGKIWP